MSTTTSDLPDTGRAAADRHELLSFAVANSRVIFYVADTGGDNAVRFISANVEAITGHPPDAFSSDPFFGRRHVHPDDLAGFERALETLKADGQASREYRLRSAQGEYLWFRDDLKLGKGGREFVGSMVNVSERVAAEEEKQQLNRLMQDAIESLPSGFAVYDSSGRVLLCNTAFARLYGKDRESMLETTREGNVRSICARLRRFDGEEVACTESDASWMLGRLNDFARGPVEMELDDGTWMLASHSPTADGGTVVVRTDITHQKVAENALRHSEEYFRHIVENHPLPVVLFDLETGRIVYESPAVAALLRREESSEESYSALDYVPDAEERKRFARALRSSGEVKDFDARTRLHDGSPGWISITARLINYAGRDTVIASLVDLTARKSAEEALAASEARYRTLFEHAPVCIHEIDLDGRIAAMNPRGEQIA
ncbi:MAG TPA: PAS domain S-box protein, partial [Arenicellales bacterium]|nr:PAS domain S-box protein [Arenicellales bacterium]